MKNTTRNSFERMRIEAELRKLAEMEGLVEDLRAQVKAVDEQAVDTDQLRELVVPVLTKALQDSNEKGGPIAEVIAPHLAGTVRDEISDTLSDMPRLQQAIAPVISGALRDAGVSDHGALASAMAPFVVQTVRTEIQNSQDELIEAIHPKLGVLIRAAVTNAVEDLNRKVDEALPVDRWIAAIKGRVTGAGPAGFLVNRARKFRIKEALLVERDSGLLLSRQQIEGTDPGSVTPDEDLLAGMLAAIQGFADDAFGSSGAGDLRRFSFTEDTVYLRATPTKLLAVRCSGVAPPEIESRIDTLLERAMEETRKQGGVESIHLLEDLEPEPEAEQDISASKLLGRGLAAVAACFLLVWGHSAVVGANQSRWLADIDNAVTVQEGLGPYPVSVTLSGDGSTARVAGLVPDAEARDQLTNSLEWIASPLELDIDLGVVHMSDPQ